MRALQAVLCQQLSRNYRRQWVMVLLPSAICKDLTQWQFFWTSFHKSHQSAWHISIWNELFGGFFRHSSRWKFIFMTRLRRNSFNSCKMSELWIHCVTCQTNTGVVAKIVFLKEDGVKSMKNEIQDSMFHVIAVKLAQSRFQRIPLHF